MIGIVCMVAATLAIASDALAGHNPPRPQVSYECSRFALKFNAKSDSWECAAGTKIKISKDTENRLRQLKRDVDARIREIQSATSELQQEQFQRLQQLLNKQRQLVRALQQSQAQ